MHSKKTLLKDILTYDGLASGYSFRGKIKDNPNGNVKVVQLKNFTNNYTSLDHNYITIDGKDIKDRFYLEDNDILFISKGSNNYAVTYKKDRQLMIASSALFVIKIDTQYALPDYVAWYINQPPVQNYFELHKLGTYTMSINKKTLENTPLVLPDLNTQKQIATIARLQSREQYLYERIKIVRKKLIQNQLLNSI